MQHFEAHAIRAAGASSPVRVFLHGFTGTPASWDAVLAHLPAGGNNVVMRVPGHHPAVPVLDCHAPEAFERTVDAMAAALATLDCGPVHLIGYSLGARLALGLAARASADVPCIARLTLFGGHPGLRHAKARAERAERDAAWEAMLRTQGLPVFFRHWLAQPIFARLAHVAPQALAADVEARMTHAPHALADALAATSLARMPDLWEALPDIRVPVCFATGSEDEKFSAMVHAAQAMVPRSMQSRIPGAGHNVLLEAPASVARLITTFEKR